MQDCRAELWALLGEEVCVLREHLFAFAHAYMSTNARSQRLAGASILILANKQDLPGALPPEEIRKVR